MGRKKEQTKPTLKKNPLGSKAPGRGKKKMPPKPAPKKQPSGSKAQSKETKRIQMKPTPEKKTLGTKKTQTKPTPEKKPLGTKKTRTKPAPEKKPLGTKKIQTKPTPEKKPLGTKKTQTKPTPENNPLGLKALTKGKKKLQTKPTPEKKPLGPKVNPTLEKKRLGLRGQSMETKNTEKEPTSGKKPLGLKHPEPTGNEFQKSLFRMGEHLDMIFQYLRMPDLANLRLTCREGRDALDAFVLRSLSANKGKKEEDLIHFYDTNKDCLLPHERKLFEASRANPSNCFLRFRMAHGLAKDWTKRLSLTQADVPRVMNSFIQILPERDDKLQRTVTRLLWQRWLFMRLDLGTYEEGDYTMRVRLKVPWKEVNGNSQDNWTVSVTTTDLTNVIVEESIKISAWKKIAKGTLRHSSIRKGSDDWMYLILKFTLTESSDLNFYFNDQKMGAFRSNIYWDFVEIQDHSADYRP